MDTNQPVEELKIVASADVSSAKSGLDGLLSTIKDLQKISGRVSLKSYSTAITDISTASNNIKSDSGDNLKKLADGLQQISNVGKLHITPGMASKLETISTSVDKISSMDMSGAKSLADALSDLSAIGSMGNLASATRSLGELPDVLNDLKGINADSINGVVSALKPLQDIGKSNLGPTINQLKKLPETMQALNAIPSADMAEFSNRVQTLVQYLAPLATQLDSIGQGFARLPPRIQQAITATSRMDRQLQSLNSTGKSSTQILRKVLSDIRRVADVFRTVAVYVGQAFKASNDFVEASNLFAVSMGDAAESARDFADEAYRMMGIDVADWMTYQGTFQNLITGFDIASDKAAIMSKNLTQLSYDLASFFNTDVQTSFEKLSSAMAGQVKGLREYGVNTTVAALQEYALSKGITEKVSSMDQASKTMLRYSYIMEKTTSIQNDMARTLITPANSLRVLQAQWQVMIRTMGQVVSVIATKVIPIVQSLVNAITALAARIASFFGYSLPSIDYSGLSTGAGYAEDMEESLTGANGAAKALKKTILGIDQINKLDDNKSGGGGGGAGGGGVDIGDIDIPAYNFFKGLLDGITDGELSNELKIIRDVVDGIGAAFLVWKLAPAMASFLNDVKTGKIAGGLKNLKIAAGIGLMITGFRLEYDGAFSIGKDGADLKNVLMTMIGSALGIAGSLLTFGTGPAGWIIGIGVSLAVGVTAYLEGIKEAAKEAYEATQDFEIMNGIIQRSGQVSEDTASRLANLKSNIAELKGVEEKFSTARELLDHVYELSGKANKSAYELQIMRLEVNQLDGMGIHLDMNEAQTEITTTREEAEKLIDTMERTAKTAALTNLITSAYESLYKAQKDNKGAAEDLSAAYDAVKRTEAEIRSSTHLTARERADLNAKYQEEYDALQAAQGAYNDTIGAMNDIIGIIGDYEGALNELSGNADETSKDVAKSVDELTDATIGAASRYAESLGLAVDATSKTYTEDIPNVLYDAQAILGDTAFADGEYVVAGLVDGADTAMVDSSGLWAGIFNKIVGFFRDTLRIGSPSKVMRDEARWIGAGVYEGVDDSINEDDYDSIFDRIRTSAENMWDSLTEWWKKLSLPEIKFPTPHFSWGSYYLSGTIANIMKTVGLTPAIPKLNVEWYASGGFPTTGQMFVAREAGPELVGQIGHKTTVANNDQIVDGISAGVAEANMEQNALLREEISLMREQNQLIRENGSGGSGGGHGMSIGDIQRKNRRDGRTIIPVGI